MKKLIHLDDLVRECGYFYSFEDEEGNWPVFGGYNCKHEKCNTDMNDSEKYPNIGTCSACCCPMGIEASYNDMLELDIELAKEYEEKYKSRPDETTESGW